MIRHAAIAVAVSVWLAGCATQTEAPIDESSAAARVSTATPVTVAKPVMQPSGAAPSELQQPARAMALPAEEKQSAGVTAALPAQVVETRPLPAEATRTAAEPPLSPLATPPAAGVTTPGAHRDPLSPLVQQRVIYFAFDSAIIEDQYRPVLELHAHYLKANPGFRIMLQGHTDERGSREYNMALGQRRAESVRQALSLLGVADGQMEAVSFGEEKPAAEGHDEAAWRLNRRTEIHYLD